jgi:hypothetical protein
MAKQKRRAATRKAKRRKSKALHKKAATRAAPKKQKKSGRKIGKKRTPSARRRGAPVSGPARKKKRSPAPSLQIPIETTIVDVIEEPAPGVMVITEFEATRVAIPDSEAEDEDPDSAPEKNK